MSTQPTPPTVNPSGGSAGSFDANAQFQANLAAVLGAASGGGTGQQPIVPLWVSRPAQGGAGSANAAENETARVNDFVTKDAAQSAWLDLSPDQKQAFAKSAIASDFWKPSQGADGLVQAWYHAVDIAEQYNATHGKDKYLSPFEAVGKLAAQDAAHKNGKFDGLSTSTDTTVQQFTDNDLYSQAKAILQRNLGRDPSKEELHAYTVAVNAAASQQPQVTTTATNGGANAIDPQTDLPVNGNTQRVVYGQGGFNPEQTIDNMVKNTDEYAQYQAAVDYFPAVMNALGAIA